MTCRGCGSRTAVGCLCSIASSDCFTAAGAGSEASPFTLSPRLNPSANNLLTCGGDGLLGELPDLVIDPPSVSLSRTSNQSIATNTLTALAFNVEIHDTDSMFSSGANTRITFTTAGVYLVTLYALWDSEEAVRFGVIRIRKNGSDILGLDTKRADGTSGDLFIGQTLTILESFAAADYIEAMVIQNVGSNLAVVAEHGSPLFTAERVASA